MKVLVAGAERATRQVVGWLANLHLPGLEFRVACGSPEVEIEGGPTDLVLAVVPEARPEDPLLRWIGEREGGPRVLVLATAPVRVLLPDLGEGGEVLRYPADPDRVRAALVAAHRALEDDVAVRFDLASAEIERFAGLIVGRNPQLRRALQVVARVARTDAACLVTGETGTGKELIARAIHQLSRRRDEKYVAVNTGAIPAELLEAELFGHVKGAFTGAIGNRQGRFPFADRGTLVLDEVAEMPLAMQVKLLRALQERSIEPVGSPRPVPVDVRVVAMTHRDLRAEVEAGRFREDLYYRLNVIPIEVPALRDRPEDFDDLVVHFAREHNERHGLCIRGISAPAMDALRRYAWPGNIRELSHKLEHVMMLASGTVVQLSDIPWELRDTRGPARTPAAAPAEPIPRGGIDFYEARDRFETRLLVGALEQCGWNKNRASQLLKMKRTTLVERLKRLGIADPEAPCGEIDERFAWMAPA